METKIKISVNKSNLLTTVELVNLSNKIINHLIIIFTNTTNEIDFNDSFLKLSWHDFKRCIVNISQFLKNENILIEFDEFSNTLLREYLRDRKYFKKNHLLLDLTVDDLKELLKSSQFTRDLKKEQERDALKLLKLLHGANFSVPGAGKTTTILAVHSILKFKGIVNTLFVIAPINAFISWEDEIQSIFKNRQLKVIRLTSNLISNFSSVISEKPDVILVNYEKMRKDVKFLTPYFVTNRVHLILDESHRIKSGNNNLSYSQIVKISDLVKRRDILSGTPMPQSYLDLEPQFDFLWPGEKIIPNDSSTSTISEINSAIKDLYVRTTKVELGLKEPIIKFTKLEMGPIQSELYKLFKSEAARLITGMGKIEISNFRKIGKSVIRLLQASTNPMLLGTVEDYSSELQPIPPHSQVWELLEELIKYEKSPKIEYLKKRINEILSKNHHNKIIIWSFFVRNIQLLERLLKEYNPVSIYGGIPTGNDDDEKNRESRIKKFHNDPNCRLIIANPQACGEGISLHKVCHYAIYLDRSFNAAHYLQSIDRIHRLGLDNSIDTNIEILISKNSIDEILISRLSEKILAMGEILDDKYLKTLAYDPSDISIEDDDGIDLNDFEAIKNHIFSND